MKPEQPSNQSNNQHLALSSTHLPSPASAQSAHAVTQSAPDHNASRSKTVFNKIFLGKLCLGLAGGLSVLLLSLPAEAGRLRTWRFDSVRNRLEFRTDDDVQPQAQLIANPTRLVIDLPGINWGRPALTQAGRGNIQAIRVAQFERNMTRIVVELAPGYTMDPNQVKFRGNSPTSWSVQLPQPIADPNFNPNAVVGQGPTPGTGINPNPGGFPPPQPASFGTQLADLQATPEGLYLRTVGGTPVTSQVQRSRNRRQIYLIFEGLALANTLHNRTIELNRYGVSSLQLQQLAGVTPSVRLTLNVDPNSPSWQANLGPAGGIAITPVVGVAGIPGANPPPASFSLLGGAVIAIPPGTGSPNNPPPTSPGFPRETGGIATINAVDLGGDQLLIRADRPLSFITRPERGGRYRVIIRNAQFASNMQQPRLGLGSAVSRIDYRQDNDQMVSILLTPAQGVRVLNAQIFSSSSVLVQFQRPDTPPSTSFPGSEPTVITPQPPFGGTPPPENLDPFPEGTPRRTNERPVVVIDPGHGGRDPGAIGIGGIRETDIVLDISLEIARTLQQQGIIVRLTRTTEVEIDLAPRVAMGERANADVFVSIHANAISMSRPDINGLEVFYSPGRPRSARFAATLHNTIVSTMNMRTRGLKVARFYVIRRNSMPSALIETGFVTGSEDAPNLASPAWRRQMARAIARGILLYLRGGGG